MSILEHLTKFSPSGVNLQYSEKSSRPGLTAFDIVASLKGDDVIYHFGNWYVNQNQGSRTCLLRHLLRKTQQIASKDDWTCADDVELLGRMCETALVEFMSPRICRICKGTGVLKLTSCEKCFGDGRVQYKRVELARMCGVSSKHWKNIWEPKYQLVFNELIEKRDELERKLYKKIGGSYSHLHSFA